MWGYEEFIAKTKLYFSRGSEVGEDHDSEAMVWYLLGLEFLLRAPLAKIHPSLLALPEGDSMLHAAGIVRATTRPRSIPTKTVVDRLTKVDPGFGEDRAKDALFLAELRNEELHASSAILENTPPDAWLPRFISVVDAVCDILKVPVQDLVEPELVEEANTYRETAKAAVRRQVQQMISEAGIHFGRLSEEEKIARRAARPSQGSPRLRTVVSCPACHEETGIIILSQGRPSKGTYSDEDRTVTYSQVQISEEYACRMCSLNLASTAQIIAAGLPRLHVEEYEEDRYEGWEELMTYEDAVTFMGEEYGND